MSTDEFSRKIFDALNSYDVNLKFVEEWHRETLNSLKIIKDQSVKIKNPRHLGDFLEEQVKITLNRLIPKRYSLEKGYGINYFSGISGEQDLLVIDNSLGAAICSTDAIGYYPIECILASIEVKSTLTYGELEKCIISCINIKKLILEPFVYADNPKKRIFYSIFAYSTKHSSASFLKRLNKETENIPESLRPNCIFIINHGIYLPSVSGYILFDLEHIQKCLESYLLIESTEKQEAQNFVLFFSILIEHSLQQSSCRDTARISSYVITPSVWQNSIKKNNNNDGLIKKYPNRNHYWIDPHPHPIVPQHEKKCGKCGEVYNFVMSPPGSSKVKENFRKSFAEHGLIAIDNPKDMYACSCGNRLKTAT
jgi:hypothetical protein